MKRRRALLIAFIMAAFYVLSAGVSHAVTVSVSPNSANTGQTVTVMTTATFSFGVTGCNMNLNFGDGSPLVTLTACPALNCTYSNSHAYLTPGTFTITVSNVPLVSCSSASPPLPAFTSVTILAPCPALSITTGSLLPSATAGQAYSQQIQHSGGQPPVSFSLAGGSLPPGLNLGPTGLISGTPTTSGNYSFAVRATDSCSAGAQGVQKSFTTVVNLPAVIVTTSPSSFRIPRNTTSVQNISYYFTSSSPAVMTLLSDKGIFSVGGDVIGEVSIPLSASIANGVGRVSEVLTIPPAISLRAENLGTTRITFIRPFSHGSTSVTGQAEISVTTEAGADFKITRIQLYFENQSAQTTVKRNEPLRKIYADLKFTGSGLLRGYWEVDGRILFNEFRHLVYGTDITLTIPDTMTLPTFDVGTHVVRFVITEPSESLPIPEAIYFVTSEEFKEIQSIKLIAPEDMADVGYAATDFVWYGKEPTANYLIEFQEEGGGKPLFAAYTRKPQYRLPESVLKGIFSPGKKYFWRVKGFDTGGNVSRESPIYRFTFKEPVS